MTSAAASISSSSLASAIGLVLAVPATTAIAAAKLARAAGAVVMLNASPGGTPAHHLLALSELVDVVVVNETEAAEGFELPGADLSGEEMSVRVLPRQADEFTCTSCFLVHHRSQLATDGKNGPVCTECAA